MSRARVKLKLIAATVLTALAGSSVGMGFWLMEDMPQIAGLEEYRPSLSTRVYAADGQLIAEFAQQKRILVPLVKMPKSLQNAMIAIEDHRFYQHWGLDFVRIIRALQKDIEARKIVQGGSTITQQLARDLFLTLERTLGRKLKEALIALQIERRYTKQEILELYLNQIYLGEGAYGVESAARAYFGKHVEDLTLGECALLAGLPKAPNYFSPRKRPQRARARRQIVLRQMLKYGYISRGEYEQASQEEIVLRRFIPKKVRAPYFVEYVRQQIANRYGFDALYTGGLSVYTTLDLKVQEAAEQTLIEEMPTLDARKVRNKGRRARAIEDVAVSMDDMSAALGEPQEVGADTGIDSAPLGPIQCALVVLEPSTGHIVAMVGGRDFSRSEFNRAVQAKRQPGSGFKPIIWAAALDNGFTPSDIIIDSPIAFEFQGETWMPENYDEEFFGPTTLRCALEHSRNVVSVKLLQKVGIGRVKKYARRMGITSFIDHNLSVALGTSVVSPLEIASAYATLANRGIYVKPSGVLRIVAPDRKVIGESHPQEKVVLSETTAYLTTHLMQGVVKRGTGRPVRIVGRPIAGKTGTTDNYTDAWFMGYTPQLCAVLWIGYDRLLCLGEKQTGGRVAGPIWAKFMMKALKDRPVMEFLPPDGIVFVDVHYGSGLLASSDGKEVIREAFLKGTQPRRYYDPEGEREFHTYDLSLLRNALDRSGD